MDKLNTKLKELHEKVKFIINKRVYTEYLRNRKFSSNTFKINSLEDMMNTVLKCEDLKIKRFYFNQYSLSMGLFIEGWEEHHLTHIINEVEDLFNKELKLKHTNKIDSIPNLIKVLSLLEKEVCSQLHKKKLFNYETFTLNLYNDIEESNKTDLHVHYQLVKIITFLEIIKTFESYDFIQLNKELSYCNISYITEAMEKNALFNDKENTFGKLLGIDIKLDIEKILSSDSYKNKVSYVSLVYEEEINYMEVSVYNDSVELVSIPYDPKIYDSKIKLLDSVQECLFDCEPKIKNHKNEFKLLHSLIRFIINRLSEKRGIGEMYVLLRLCATHLNIFVTTKRKDIEEIENYEEVLSKVKFFIQTYLTFPIMYQMPVHIEETMLKMINNVFQLESINFDNFAESFFKSSVVKIKVKTNMGHVSYDIRMSDDGESANKIFTIDKNFTTSDLRDLKIF